jgi:LPS export ABC transporter protein LptC
VSAGLTPRLLRPGALALALLLSGCISRTREAAAPEPFVFRALDLRQQSATGQPAWDLTSPEARYDLNRRLAQARRPRGTVYRNGQPYLNLSAESATVIGDGQAIVLEGEVRLTLMGRDPVRISADQVRWLPGQDLMAIDQRPVASDRRLRISAGSARYHLNQDRLELRGAPLLEQWQQNQPLGTTRAAAPIRLRVSRVDWRPAQGGLEAPGLVRAERSDSGSHEPLRLTATGLSGNLRQGMLALQAPVLLRNGSGSSWLRAGQVHWTIQQPWLTSAQPFRGAVNQLQASGAGWRVNLAEQTVLVSGDCALQQPGVQLTAGRCFWHWPSGRFSATGQVLLRRSAYGQITRATQLQGQIGANGLAQFSSPGARVDSSFTLPPPSRRSGSPPQAAPVVF